MTIIVRMVRSMSEMDSVLMISSLQRSSRKVFELLIWKKFPLWKISQIKPIKFFVNDNSGKNNEQDLASTFGRRFQIGQNDEFSSDNNDDIMRTKRRTQRLTLLMAKVQSTRSGERLRPREFLRQINNYGTFQKDYRFIFGFVGSRKNGLKMKKNGRLISD